jgi:hypothetical protein
MAWTASNNESSKGKLSSWALFDEENHGAFLAPNNTSHNGQLSTSCFLCIEVTL